MYLFTYCTHTCALHTTLKFLSPSKTNFCSHWGCMAYVDKIEAGWKGLYLELYSHCQNSEKSIKSWIWFRILRALRTWLLTGYNKKAGKVMSMRFSPLPLTSIGRSQIFADGGTLLKICHNRPTQCLHAGGKVNTITFSALNENHKHSFFHSLASADSVSQTQATAGKDPVNAKGKTMTLNIPEEEDTAAKMHTNIRHEQQ